MSEIKKWVLVTGAAHRVGKAIATEFVSRGYNLHLHYGRSKQKAEVTSQELMEFGNEINLIQADLSDYNQIELLMERVGEYGIDVLVNSAAGFYKTPFLDISVDEWDSVINVNLKAPFFLTQIASKYMMKNSGQDRGAIVNISDLSGIHPWKGYSHHGIAKSGLIHLTKISAIELAPYIRVNAITPGLIIKPAGLENNQRWAEMQNNIPLNKSGSPKDVASTAYFLANHHFMTGNIVAVDGGENLVGNINHT